MKPDKPRAVTSAFLLSVPRRPVARAIGMTVAVLLFVVAALQLFFVFAFAGRLSSPNNLLNIVFLLWAGCAVGAVVATAVGMWLVRFVRVYRQLVDITQRGGWNDTNRASRRLAPPVESMEATSKRALRHRLLRVSSWLVCLSMSAAMAALLALSGYWEGLILRNGAGSSRYIEWLRFALVGAGAAAGVFAAVLLLLAGRSCARTARMVMQLTMEASCRPEPPCVRSLRRLGVFASVFLVVGSAYVGIVMAWREFQIGSQPTDFSTLFGTHPFCLLLGLTEIFAGLAGVGMALMIWGASKAIGDTVWAANRLTCRTAPASDTPPQWVET